jgi:hypothetical protein
MATAPSTENYLLGRGRILFDRFDANGNPQGFIDLGNAPDFSISISKDMLEHFSSRSGLRVKDLSVVRELSASFVFTLEEFSLQNLLLALMGESADESQTAGSVTDEAVTARHDKWVDLAKRKVSNVVVTAQAGSPTYTENTDYVVDYDEGMIKVLSTGSIGDGDALLVDYSYADLTQAEVRSLKEASVDGKLKFIGDPAQGPALVIEVWKCKLSPSGDIGLIGDDLANFQLTAEVEKDETGHPDSPYFSVHYIGGGWD